MPGPSDQNVQNGSAVSGTGPETGVGNVPRRNSQDSRARGIRMSLDEQTRAQSGAAPQPSDEHVSPPDARPACPVCGGRLYEIRAKLHCSQCHTICETCCEGGPG